MSHALSPNAEADALNPVKKSKFSDSGKGSEISTQPSGSAGTTDYRLFFYNKDGNTISPWHDIPLYPNSGRADVVNCVIEIPKNSRDKMEIATKEAGNPIAQDIKKGKLRQYHGPIFWNYGCFPQTWEDPSIVDPVLNVRGDNDPLDVVEIGSAALPTGSVAEVKILGCLAMIDDGELDWKVIAISASDEKAAHLNDIKDVEEKLPGVISGIREWFRWYKTPDDKPLNMFGYDEKALSKEVALGVVHDTHEHWVNLKEGKTEKGSVWVA